MHTCLCNRNRVNSIKQTFGNMEKLYIFREITSIALWRHTLLWIWNYSDVCFKSLWLFLNLFCEVTLGPLCEVKVWLFPENCDICSGSPSGRVTRFYPNRKSCESAVFLPPDRISIGNPVSDRVTWFWQTQPESGQP